MVHLSRHCQHYHPLPYLHPILPCPPILTHHPDTTICSYLPITRYFHTPLYLLITRYFYTPADLHITFHTPIDLHISRYFGSTCHPTIITHISPFTYHILSSPTIPSTTLPPIDETMVDLVSDLGALPPRRPRVPRTCQVLHPSTPSAQYVTPQIQG